MNNYYEYEELVFDTRKEAERVIENMLDLADKYSFVTVADMYDLTGVMCSYADNKYGWVYDQIKNAYPALRRDGLYRIPLPSPYPVDTIEKMSKSAYKYVSCTSKSGIVSVNLDAREMREEEINTVIDILNGVIKANPDRKINITIE